MIGTPGPLTTVALVLSSPEEHGSSAGFLGIPNLVWQILNLSLFLVLLVYLLKKPIAGFFGGRRASVEETVKKAEADRRRAEELRSEIAARLTGIETQLAELKERSVRDERQEREAEGKQAEIDAQRLLARGAAEVDARLRDARAELTAYAGDLAVDMAEKVLKKTVTPDDHRRLVSEGVDGLERAGRSR